MQLFISKLLKMKKYFNRPSVLLLAAILFFGSCSKSSVDPLATNATTTTAADITASLTAGKWVISSFTEKKEDKSSNFTNFTFVFAVDGTVTATANGIETKGTWKFTPAVTYYGSSSKSAVAISMGINKPFDLLSKTWNLVSSSSTLLKVDSPEVLQDEHLQFSKQ